MIRRSIDADEHLGAGFRHFLHRIAQVEAAFPELVVVPGVLADRQRSLPASDEMQGLACRRDKLSRFIEDVVGGQQHFVLPENNRARARSALRCWWPFFRFRFPRARHIRRRSPHRARQFRRPTGPVLPGRASRKLSFSTKSRRWVAREGKLWKDNDFCAARNRFPAGPDHAVRIAAKITDSCIKLSERDSHPVVPILRDVHYGDATMVTMKQFLLIRIRIGEPAFADRAQRPPRLSQKRLPHSPLSAGSPCRTSRRPSGSCRCPRRRRPHRW